VKIYRLALKFSEGIRKHTKTRSLYRYLYISSGWLTFTLTWIWFIFVSLEDKPAFLTLIYEIPFIKYVAGIVMASTHIIFAAHYFPPSD
jgi:hypothetical protein